MLIDEWAAEQCGIDLLSLDNEILAYVDGKDIRQWSLKRARCRDRLRNLYRQKGWMVTFTRDSVIYHLPATEKYPETHMFVKDNEISCFQAIMEAQNNGV